MRRPVPVEQRIELIGAVADTAIRLEQQPSYAVDTDTGWPARWLDGDRTPPTEWDQGFDQWFDFIRALTVAGRRIERIRVVEEPPTDYQRWEAWLGQWNVEAGETIRYLTRSAAERVGISSDDGDWWLFDGTLLLEIRFDEQGCELPMTLSDEPVDVERARSLWLAALPHCRQASLYEA